MAVRYAGRERTAVIPLHVSRTVVLIIRRSKLYYTASGIITPVGGRPVHRLREDSSHASTCFEHCCAHHQEVKIVLYSIWYRHTCRWPSGAKFFYKTKICALNWSDTKIIFLKFRSANVSSFIEMDNSTLRGSIGEWFWYLTRGSSGASSVC